MGTTPVLAPAAGAAAVALTLAPSLAARAVQYQHKVVVPTTSLGREIEVAAGLERDVNALAALVGGDSQALDAMRAVGIGRASAAPDIARRSLCSGTATHWAS